MGSLAGQVEFVIGVDTHKASTGGPARRGKFGIHLREAGEIHRKDW